MKNNLKYKEEPAFEQYIVLGEMDDGKDFFEDGFEEENRLVQLRTREARLLSSIEV